MALRCDSNLEPGTPYLPTPKFSFFIDRYVMPGIYSPHLEGCPIVFVGTGAANGLMRRCNSQSREYEQARTLAIEDRLNFGEVSQSHREKSAVGLDFSQQIFKVGIRRKQRPGFSQQIAMNRSTSPHGSITFMFKRNFAAIGRNGWHDFPVFDVGSFERSSRI